MAVKQKCSKYNKNCGFMSPFLEFAFCDCSCDKRFSNLLATGSIGSCAPNLAEAMVGSKIAAVSKLKEMSTMQKERTLDKAPRLSIRIVIWILPSDSDTVFVHSTKISTNTETAMLPTQKACFSSCGLEFWVASAVK